MYMFYMFLCNSSYESSYYSYFIFEDTEVQRYFILDQGRKV